MRKNSFVFVFAVSIVFGFMVGAASAADDGTIARVRDTAPLPPVCDGGSWTLAWDGGAWGCAPVSGSGGGSSCSLNIMQATLNDIQQGNVAAGDHIIFDKTIYNVGTDIYLVTDGGYSSATNAPSIGRFTLKNGKPFRIQFIPGYQEGSAFSSYSAALFNVNDAGFIGVTGIMIDSASNLLGTNNLDAIYVPDAGDTLMEVRIVRVFGLTSIGYADVLTNPSVTKKVVPVITIQELCP